jgi:hypothetical protein
LGGGKEDESADEDDGSDHSVGSVGDDSAASEVSSKEATSDIAEPPTSGRDQPEATPSGETAHEKHADDETGKSSEEWQLPDKDVEHPTWERHDDGTSLLDLIRSQAARMVPLKKEKASGTEQLDDLVEVSHADSGGSKSEADFVVVQ